MIDVNQSSLNTEVPVDILIPQPTEDKALTNLKLIAKKKKELRVQQAKKARE